MEQITIYIHSFHPGLRLIFFFQNIFRRDLGHLGTAQNIMLVHDFGSIILTEQEVSDRDGNLEGMGKTRAVDPQTSLSEVCCQEWKYIRESGKASPP